MKIKDIIKSFLIGYPIIISEKNIAININRLRKIKFKSLGKNVEIEEQSNIFSPENIEIGNNVFIAKQSYIHGLGGVKIGSGTMIGPRVLIMTSNHRYDSKDLESIPFDNVNILKPVSIEENVWIGSNVTILPGVTLGEGSIVGMGSVVTKDVEPYCIVAGNPAKIIKYRDKDIYINLKSKQSIFFDKYRGKKTENRAEHREVYNE